MGLPFELVATLRRMAKVIISIFLLCYALSFATAQFYLLGIGSDEILLFIAFLRLSYYYSSSHT